MIHVPALIIPKSKKVLTRNWSKRGSRNGYALAHANDTEAFNVKLWAREAVAILTDNLILGNLVHRDFSPMIQEFGDTVNTRKPAEFVAVRKTNDDNVTVQNATATNIPVKLNQLVHVSYLIRDGQESTSFESLVQSFLLPAMIAEADFIDTVLATQVYQFISNSAGRLGQMDETTGKRYILDTRKVMNDNKAYSDGRNLVVGSAAETTLLDIENFTDANRVGDDGTALSRAILGSKFGYNIRMDQNMPYVSGLTTVVTGAINHAGTYAAGTTSLTVDGLSAAITAGTWFTVAGDDTPLQVASTTGGSTPTVIVSNYPLKRAVADNAVITLCPTSTTTAAYTYDSATNTGYSGDIAITAFSGNTPQVGQLVSFGSSTIVYGIVKVNSTTSITLDRPIEASIASGATVNLGPAGGFNWAFHRNALTMVSRPLARPREGTGAMSEVVNFNNMSVRVVMTYDGNAQGTLVTIDILFGVKKLDPNLGAVMLS